MRYIIFLIGLSIITIRMIYPNIVFDLNSLLVFSIISFVIILPNLGDLFKRIKKVKAGGIELELLENLEKETQTIENKSIDYSIDNFTEIELANKINDPRGTLIFLSIEIEKTLRYFTYRDEHQNVPMSVLKLISNLVDDNILTKDLANIFRQFWEIRNKIIHGHDSNIDDNELYKVIDIGLRVLKILKSEEGKYIAFTAKEYEDKIRQALTKLNIDFKDNTKIKNIYADFEIETSKGTFIIEAKHWKTNLDNSVVNQLRHYFDKDNKKIILITNKEFRSDSLENLKNVFSNDKEAVSIIVAKNYEEILDGLKKYI